MSGTVPSIRRWNQRKRGVGSSRLSPVLFSLALCLNHLYSRPKWTKGGSLTTNAVSLDTLNTDSIKSVPGDTETTTTSPNPLLEKSSLHPDAPPPDVGIVPWLQVLAGFFLMFNAWGIVLSYGTFQSYYTSPTSPLHDSTFSSAIAWIGSTQAFLLAFGGALSGKYFDAGYFRQMLYAGTFMIVFGLMMTSLATQYYQVLLAQGLCVGGGTGLLLVSSVGLPSTWFVRRRGLAVGVVSTGASVAGIVFPIALRHLIPTVGFGWAARILGFISLSTLAVSIALIRQRLPPRRRGSFIEYKALKQPEFALYVAGFCFNCLGFYTFYDFVEEWAVATHVDTKGLPVVYILPILNAASIFGRIIPAFISDYLGPLNIQVPSLLMSGLLVLVWIPAHTIGPLMILTILYGFFSGAVIAMPPVAISSMTENMTEFGGRMVSALSSPSYQPNKGTTPF